jgi:hypothetical protein
MATVTGAIVGGSIAAVSHVAETGSFDGIGEAIAEGMIDGAIDGFVTGSATAFVGAAANGINALSQSSQAGRSVVNNGCFVAGTAVLTINGTVAIENIEVGDLVLSYNEETGETEYKEVVQLFRYEKYELIHVKLKDGQEIQATTEHPFYVVNEGWFAAKDLRAGDRLLLSNGKYVVVEWIQHEILENLITVYNFEVANNHNYYVAENININSNDFVLVHNNCGFNKLYNDPGSIVGKSADDVGNILDDGFTRTSYGSRGDGWRFIDKAGNKIAYNTAGGRHDSAYYILQKANVGTRLKVIGAGYNKLNEVKTIYYIFNGIIP